MTNPDNYIQTAIKNEVEALASMGPATGRTAGANTAAFNLGRFVVSGELRLHEVVDPLWHACLCNGLVADDGEYATRATLASGLRGAGVTL